MKKTLLTICLNLLLFSLHSQEYYWYQGEEIDLEINYNYFYVVLDDPDTAKVFQEPTSLNYSFEQIKSGFTAHNQNTTWRILKVVEDELTKSDYQNTSQELKQHEDVVYVGKVIGSTSPIAISEYIYVKLKNEGDYLLLEQAIVDSGCEIEGQVPNMPLWYRIRVDKYAQGTALELINQFHESGNFAKTDPGFMFNVSTTACLGESEAWFDDQWALSENTSGPQGSRGINVCNAWDITAGSEDVILAVFDNGIQLDHPELENGFTDISYDADSDESLSVHMESNNHGTNVAGIIGANQNGLKISGVTPNSLIMPIMKKKSAVYSLNTTTPIPIPLASQLKSGNRAAILLRQLLMMSSISKTNSLFLMGLS